MSEAQSSNHVPEQKGDFVIPVRYGIGVLVFARFVMLMCSSIEGIRGYGDFIHFFRLASLPGWPYLNYWVEFPPLFSFLISFLYRLAGGREHTFDYLLIILLTTADAISLWFFYRLTERIKNGMARWAAVGSYLGLMICLPYFWWYFDPFAVCALLIGLDFILENQPVKSGIALGSGALVKFFPVLGLAAGWGITQAKHWWKSLVVGILIVAGLYGLLFAVSPEYTRASLASQGSKGSWETIWAVIDRNYKTGNFGPEKDRLDANKAYQSMGKTAKIPVLFTLAVFGLIGLAGMITSDPEDDRQRIALVGFIWCIFFLWSPGWSPQWLLYLIPLILLVFDSRIGTLLTVTLVLTNLLEWPILLSRGMFWTLPLTIALRTLVMILFTVMFYQEIRHIRVKDIWKLVSKKSERSGVRP